MNCDNGTKSNRGNGHITIGDYRFSFYSNLQRVLTLLFPNS